MITKRSQLEGDIRQAFENYMGEMVSGAWDDLIDTLAEVVDEGDLPLETAARIHLLLRRTQGGPVPDTCTTCHCPVPGLTHGEHA